MARILIVEDDPLVASFLDKGLSAHGYLTAVAADAVRAGTMALSEDHDLVLLDMTLPDGDGYEILRRIRGAGSRVPIIVLTGRSELRDVVECLDVGADDYMTKPFRFDELLARLRVRLRPPATTAQATLRAGRLELDLRARQLKVDGGAISLSRRELGLIEWFLRHPGQVLSQAQLLSAVWGFDFDPGTNVVPVYIRALRHKLGPELIETVRGLGYRLNASAAAP